MGQEIVVFAITGITGQVGGVVARDLLAAGEPVRAILRNAEKGRIWAERGCEVAVADMADADALAAAFRGSEGVFVLIPPIFDPAPGFPEVRAVIGAVRQALEAARPTRAVALSTIGAQASEPNLLNQLGLMEEALGQLSVPIAFLRAAWFIENCKWDIAPARETGVAASFLQPLDKLVPMVATEDIGRVAAALLRESWTGRREIELEGPRRISPNDLAHALSAALGRPVRMEVAPRETWEEIFVAQGMRNPEPRMRMLDGFNEGWIEFEAGEAGSQKGRIDADAALRKLVEHSA
jgi:uncharacterized protein YbjT (DUF2867 family)